MNDDYAERLRGGPQSKPDLVLLCGCRREYSARGAADYSCDRHLRDEGRQLSEAERMERKPWRSR